MDETKEEKKEMSTSDKVWICLMIAALIFGYFFG